MSEGRPASGNPQLLCRVSFRKESCIVRIYSLECTVDLQSSEVVRQLELVGGVCGVDDEVKLELVLVGPALV